MEIIEIRDRWTEALLYSGEHVDVKEAIEAAVMRGANMDGADLRGANLDYANLDGADLRGAYLDYANLRGANMDGANLRGANLDYADLGGANLRGANMDGAKVCAGNDEATLAGSRPIVQIGPIGSRNDWLTVFWCGDAGVRISTGCQQQITEEYFLQRLAEAHGAGDDADIHAENYLAALEFAKRLLKAQQDDALIRK